MEFPMLMLLNLIDVNYHKQESYTFIIDALFPLFLKFFSILIRRCSAMVTFYQKVYNIVSDRVISLSHFSFFQLVHLSFQNSLPAVIESFQYSKLFFVLIKAVSLE